MMGLRELRSRIIVLEMHLTLSVDAVICLPIPHGKIVIYGAQPPHFGKREKMMSEGIDGDGGPYGKF